MGEVGGGGLFHFTCTGLTVWFHIANMPDCIQDKLALAYERSAVLRLFYSVYVYTVVIEFPHG